MPEVSLVAILDADKEGFLRSSSSLIQTIGRAARHIRGTAILYADYVTESMRAAIGETNRRREKQQQHNNINGIVPESVEKEVKDIIEGVHVRGRKRRRGDSRVREAEESVTVKEIDLNDPKQVAQELKRLEKQMSDYSTKLEFEKAAVVRDQLNELKQIVFLSQ